RIRNVECLCPKLGSKSLLDWESFSEHHIQCLISGTDYGISGRSANRKLRSLRERSCVEPACCAALIAGQLRVAHAVRTLNAEACECVEIRCLRYGKRTSRLQPQQAAEPPTAPEGVAPTGQAPGAPLAEWKFPYKGTREDVGYAARRFIFF